MSWEQFFALEPMAKARPRVTRRGTYMPPNYTAWRERFVLSCKDVPKVPLSGSLSLTLMILTKSGKMRPDLDNVTGAVLDALQDARVIGNDRDVTCIYARIVKDKVPGIEVKVAL